MRTRLLQLLEIIGSTFWLLPAALVILGLLGGEGLVDLERSGHVPDWLLKGWLYSGGGSGARTLLGSVASSTIGVAGTIFSITIASLSLASSQMGPRLLSNFTRDRGNQVTLGLFLGTFAFALMVLRSVRGADEGDFVPHLAVTVGIGLAFGCVAMLVYFVHHMAGRINVDTVIDLVHLDLRRSVGRLTLDKPDVAVAAGDWKAAAGAVHSGQGYLQQVDDEALADWALEHDVKLRLRARPGEFVFPGVILLEASAAVEGLDDILANATAVGGRRVGNADLEFTVRQLVDVAVRALSPGINDPQTAIAALDRLAAALCQLAERHLASGVFLREGQPVFSRPTVTYDGLVDAMFNMIRQSAETSPAVLIHLVEVLGWVAEAELSEQRRQALQRQVLLVCEAARRGQIEAPALEAVSDRRRVFERVLAR